MTQKKGSDSVSLLRPSGRGGGGGCVVRIGLGWVATAQARMAEEDGIGSEEGVLEGKKSTGAKIYIPCA